MTRYIYWLLIASSSLLVCWSVSAAQIHTDVLPSSTVNLSYVSGGQLGSMSVHNNHPTLTQFVPYSPLNGVAYTCTPSSWLSYLSNPVGQPLMWSAPSRWLTVSCSTQCGPLMRWTAYGDEANNAYCADGSPKTFVAVTGSTDKLHWTCGSSPTQCRAYKGCIIEWHNPGSQNSMDPIASTYVWWHDITAVRIAHNQAIQLGHSQWGYGDEGLLRCVWSLFYPHAASGALACNTPLWNQFSFGPHGQNMSYYGYHPWAGITSSATIRWLNDGGVNGDSVFSVQWDTSYCSSDFGCRPDALWINDPNDNGDWIYGPWIDPNGYPTDGTCPYTGQIVTL